MSGHLILKVKVRVTVYKNRCISAIIRTMFKKLHRSDGNVAGNKNVILADLENVAQGHRLTKIIISRLLYDRFQPNFHKNDAIWLATKASHINYLACHVGYINGGGPLLHGKSTYQIYLKSYQKTVSINDNIINIITTIT